MRLFRFLLVSLLIVLLVVPCEAAVVADSHVSSTVDTATSIPNFNVNVVTATNVGCAVIFFPQTTSVTGITITVGGVSAAAVTGTTSTYSTGIMSIMYGVALGNVSGNQAVAISWTGSSRAGAAVVCANGVDQTTPLINGTEAHNNVSIGTATTAVTNASGNLAVTGTVDTSANNLSAPTATQELLFGSNNNCVSTNTCMGAQTSTATDPSISWTNTIGDGWASSGASFKAAAAAGVVPRQPCLPLLGVSCQ
jgi:hypothetical protein